MEVTLLPDTKKVWRVVLVGGGRLGQYYADAFCTFADCAVVALVEPNAERGAAVCRKFDIPMCHASLPAALEALRDQTVDIVTIATPGRYFKECVIAAVCAHGVRAVQVEKPFGGALIDADAMAEACAAAGVVFAGGALSCAHPHVQEAAARLRAGAYGRIVGASVHAWSAELLGAGCQHTAVLRLLTGAEVVEVVAWCDDPPALDAEAGAAGGCGWCGRRDAQGRLVDAVDGAEAETGCREPAAGDTVQLSAQFTMDNGLVVPVFGQPNLCTADLDDSALRNAGVRVWTDEGVLVWSAGAECGPPRIYRGIDATTGRRARVDEAYAPVSDDVAALPWPHLSTSIRSLVAHLAAQDDERQQPSAPPLAVSGDDIRSALEISTAAYHSAMMGGVPLSLPLVDRTSRPVYPRGYRWGGGDSVGSAQSAAEVEEKGGRVWEGLSTGYETGL
jgi:predicted dehydrogenase